MLVHFIILVEHVVIEFLVWILSAIVRGLAMLFEEDTQVLLNLLRWGLLVLAATLAALAWFLLESLSVPKRIQGVVCWAHTGTNAGKHDDLALVISHERISEHHCELALTEWHMLALCRLPLLLVEGPDTLLESQERLVDLRSLSLPILVIALTVLSPFRSCEVYKEELTASFHSLLLDLDLGNGMTSTGGVISLGCMSSSHLITLVD